MQKNYSWQSVVGFYSDCYQADNRHINLWDIFKLKKHDFDIFSGQDELITGDLPRYPIDPVFADHLLQKVQTYRREKLLIYGVLFLAGALKPESFNKSRKVCAPLIYYSARINTEADASYVEISEDVQLNTPLLRSIIADDNIDGIIDTFPITTDSTGVLNVSRITSWLQEYTIIGDALPLLKYPDLVSSETLVTCSDDRASVHALSAAALALIDRPKASRGIVHELDVIIKSDHMSPPCQAILDNTYQDRPVLGETQPDILPVQLSNAQQQALSIGASETLGLVSGPPGTGKSFTIAAMIADRVLNGEKVLVVSETEQAVEVIAEKLLASFGIKEGVVRAGRAEYLKELKSYIDDLLKTGTQAESQDALKQRFKELRKSQNESGKAEQTFIRRARKSVKWGQVIAPEHPSEKFGCLKRLRIKFIRNKVRRSASHWHLMERLDRLNRHKEKLSFEYIKQVKNYQLEQSLLNNRSDLLHFSKALKARTSLKQQSFFDEIDYSVLLEAFPVWLVSLTTLHKVLPLKESLFDLVIFDESTQCNVAISIPALYRAKRAMIVGDAKQLSHVSFLSETKEKGVLAKNGMSESEFQEYSYRKNSLLDKVAGKISRQSSVTMLDEHFRSKSDIISFSNQKFYRNKLKVMQHRPGAYESGNLIFHSCSGSRDKQGVNRKEASSLIETLEGIISDSRDMAIKPSIGVLSPYRAQTEYLETSVFKSVSSNDITDHDISIGTPYHFQGEERDIMLISFSVCESSLSASGYLNREDMFNVAITRAKQQQCVFVSVSPDRLHINNLLRQYLESPVHSETTNKASDSFDYFQDVVCAQLAEHRVKTWKGFSIAGQTMDILCQLEDQFVAIDLIGFPGEWQGFFDTSSYKVFRRAGLTVIPICYASWVDDAESCLSAILKSLS